MVGIYLCINLCVEILVEALEPWKRQIPPKIRYVHPYVMKTNVFTGKTGTLPQYGSFISRIILECF